NQCLWLFNATQLMRPSLVNVIHHAEPADHWGWQNRLVTSLVAEGDVAAREWDPQPLRALRQTLRGLGELPHHDSVCGGAEVQAIGRCVRTRTGNCHVAVCLSQRKTCAHVWVQLGVAPRSIGRNSHATGSFLVDAQNTRVRLLRLHSIATHVAVVLLSNEST